MNDLDTFKKVAREITPSIEQIRTVLERHGIESSMGLTVTADGYVNMTIHQIKGVSLSRVITDTPLAIEKYERYEVW